MNRAVPVLSRALSLGVVATLLTGAAAAGGGFGAVGISAAPRVTFAHTGATASAATVTWAATRPPTTAQCRQQTGFPCYSPVQLRHAYGVAALAKKGINGSGATIAIVDSFGSPTIRHDLHVFDHAYGLPDPVLTIVHPAGKPPAFDGSSSTMRGWAGETTLDVEYAHAMAPGAHIILVETPVAETEGVHGFPAMMQSERWLLRHTKTGVISQSFGATEETFSTEHKLRALRYAFKLAKKKNVTVLGASGDDGATDYKKDASHLYHRRVNSWPSTDPLVTSIGGTRVHLDKTGHRTSRDTVWNDRSFHGGASGGGRSSVFARPAFQDPVRSVTGAHRGTPDISMNAASSSEVLAYQSFPGEAHGWHTYAGTSEASPLFAGIVALAIDKAGHRLGDLNPALYALARSGPAGIVDVVGGTNSYAGVKGYPVTRGYDLGTGWGTLNARTFVPELVHAVATH